ncbi:hemerythrin domain-containing protein [Tepidibacillus marianensis]|uniref:hemerythrin domain-containing protein n=1 Tax=Tepidibacillus marianensis TaxID=3131995 RepID=UPI0030CC3FDE
MRNIKGKSHVEDFEKILENIAVELHPFIHEHHQTWGLMKQVRDTDAAEGNMELYCQALNVIVYEIEHHFSQEEELILSRLTRYFPNEEVGPVAKLISEHRSIQVKYVEVQQLMKSKPKQMESQKQMRLLAYLVMKHIEKEDHYFYPMVSLILSESEKKKFLNCTKKQTKSMN